MREKYYTIKLMNKSEPIVSDNKNIFDLQFTNTIYNKTYLSLSLYAILANWLFFPRELKSWAVGIDIGLGWVSSFI